MWTNLAALKRILFFDGWFSPEGPSANTLTCVFGLKLPEPYLVTGTQPTGLLKMFVEKTQECQSGKTLGADMEIVGL